MKFTAKECQGLALDAGSVVDAPTAALYMQPGACFIVGPLFHADVARICNRRLVPYCPGYGTPSEISTAQEAGCDLTKVFPGQVLGAAFVKSVTAPCPWIKVMVTGGVSPTKESITEWLHAGAFCVGMGGNLFPPERVAAHDWQYVTDKCREALSYAAEARKKDA